MYVIAGRDIADPERFGAAANTGDIDTLAELFDESAVWQLPGRSSMADDHKRRDTTRWLV